MWKLIIPAWFNISSSRVHSLIAIVEQRYANVYSLLRQFRGLCKMSNKLTQFIVHSLNRRSATVNWLL